MKARAGRHSISVRIFTSFMAILILAVSISVWVTFYFASSAIQSGVMTMDRQALNSVSDTVDVILRNLEKDLYALSVSSDIRKYLTSPPFEGKYTPAQLAAFYGALSRLDLSANLNQYKCSIRLYSDKHAALIGGNERIPVEPGVIESLPRQSWIAAPSGVIPGEWGHVWFIHQVLSSAPGQVSLLIMDLNGDNFAPMLRDVADEYAIFILDSAGAPVIHEPGEAQRALIDRAARGDGGSDGQYADSSRAVTMHRGGNGWLYFKLTPLTSQMTAVTRVRNIAMVLTALMLLVTIALAYINSRRVARPVSSLTRELGISPRRGDDELQSINVFIHEMQDKQRRLNDMLRDYGQALDDERVLRVMMTPEPSQKQVDAFRAETGSVYRQFAVMLVRIDNRRQFESTLSYEAREMFWLTLIGNACSRLSESSACVGCKLGEASVALAMNADELDREELIRDARALIDWVRSEQNVSVSVAVSYAYEGAERLCAARMQAECAMADRFFEGYGSVLTNVEPRPDAGFPKLSVRRIANLIGANAEPDNEEFAQPLRDALSRGRVNLNALHAFLASLMLRLDAQLVEDFGPAYISRLDIHALAARLSDVETYDGMLHMLRTALRDMAGWVDRSNEKLHPQIRQVLRFIDEHISENFSQQEASLAVGLNPSYFSTLFKQEMGEAFLQYVQRCRIIRAKHLIARGDMTMDMVGRSVGFITPNSFIRTFKKIEGITPGQFKTNMQNSD